MEDKEQCTALHCTCRSLKELPTLSLHSRIWYTLACVHVNMHVIVSSNWGHPFIPTTPQYSGQQFYLYFRRAVVAGLSVIRFIILNLPLAFVIVRALFLTSTRPSTSHRFSLFPISSISPYLQFFFPYLHHHLTFSFLSSLHYLTWLLLSFISYKNTVVIWLSGDDYHCSKYATQYCYISMICIYPNWNDMRYISSLQMNSTNTGAYSITLNPQDLKISLIEKVLHRVCSCDRDSD